MTDDRVPLAGTAPPPVASDADRLGPADPDAQLSVTFYLRGRQPDALSEAGREWAAPISRAEYAERFGARREDVDQIEKFARWCGLEVIDEDLPGRRVRVRGSVASMEKAFHVTLNEYRQGSEQYVSHAGPVSVPASLACVLEAVLGLDTRPAVRR